MSAEAPALIKTWTVGKRYVCRLTVQTPKPGTTVSAVIEWSPRQPARLTHAEMAEYRAGRNAAIRELGLRTLVLEV